jgi:hypothetical protein
MNVDSLELILESEKNRQGLFELAESLEKDPVLAENWKDIIHTALDVIGVIPGVGEPFDLVNGILYLTTKPPDYLFAAFSFISVIPELGDVIGKGGKLAVWAAKAVERMPKTSQAAKKAYRVIAQLQDKLHDNSDAIHGLLSEFERRLKDNEQTAPLAAHVSKVSEALDIFAGNRKTHRRPASHGSIPVEAEIIG